MIEILLQAERALAHGLIDQAERMYRQAADADPRNSIAVVGLARVALERGDEATAWREARRALGIDPENVAATRLAQRLEEVWAYRGQPVPEAGAPAGTTEAPPAGGLSSAGGAAKPVEAAQGGLDAARAGATAPDSARTTAMESAGPAAAGPEPAGPEPAGPEPAGPEPAGPESAGPEPAGPESAGLESAGPTRPRPRDRGVVDRLFRRNRQ